MRALKALLVDVAPARAGLLAHVLQQAGWSVSAHEAAGADGLAAALLERGWDAVLYGGDHGADGVPARKALALVRLADPHLPFLAVASAVRPGDLSAVVQGVDGIVLADHDNLPQRLDRQLTLAARRRDAGVTRRMLHAQQSVAEHLAADLDHGELLESVLAALGADLGWSFGAVWRPDGDPPALRCVGTWHAEGERLAEFAELTRGGALTPGRGLPGRVWAFRRPMWIADAEKASTNVRAPQAIAAGLGCAAAFPVTVGDECVAVLELWDRGTRESEPEVAALLTAVGGQLAQRFARDRRAAAQLVAERERWQRYMDLTDTLIVELDRGGRVVRANRRACELLGAPESELAGRDWFTAALPEHDRATARRSHAERIELADAAVAAEPSGLEWVTEGEQPDEDETGVLTSEGHVRTIAWRHTAVRDQAGHVTGTLSSGEDVTGRRRTEQQISYLAHHDALTGLANRLLLEEHLRLALARSRRNGGGLALLHLDLDGFKLVNDSLGHTAGDELLCRVAIRVRESLRATDLLARSGGDEFLVLLADLQQEPAEMAQIVAGKIVEALAAPFELAGAEFQVGVSIGIATAPDDARDPEALLAHADTAMYQAKAGARGGWALFAAEGRDPLERLSLSAALRRALAKSEFSLHYQPIHSLAGGRLIALEALLRWEHPERGWISPGDFIPVAEETGLIEAIGDWVIRAVCEQQAAWAARGLRPLISFNVSPRQLRRLDFTTRVAEHLQETGADPSRLVLELTESSTVQNPAAAEPMLRELHALGLGIALDDFGTGYSSLSRLRQLPFETLKIDRGFLRDVPENPEAAAMVTAVLQIAAALGRDAVAEGVETEAQRAFLAEQGCSFAQGFLFARPLPPEAVEAMLVAETA